MSGKAAAQEPGLEEKIAAVHKPLQNKIGGVSKALSKKLKLSKDAIEAVMLRFMEAQVAYDLQDDCDLPVALDEKLGSSQEALTLADPRIFSKEEAEHLVAFLKDLPAIELASTYMVPCKRLVHLEMLAISMADEFLYTQATNARYAAGLKRAAEALAREAGGTFAKIWKAKAAPSILTKLYFRRGQTPNGWLTDAIQGRIICDSVDGVQDAAAFFQRILDNQQAAAAAAGRPVLPHEPSGAAILQYDVSELVDANGKLVQKIGTYLANAPPEDLEAIGNESIVVYRVRECACCSELEGVSPGEVVLVNLMLMRPCTAYAGFAYRLPEQALACTMELQVGTADAFKAMKKGADAHDRDLCFQRFPLLERLQALASGADGKLAMPSVGKGGVVKGGDPKQGKHLMDLFSALDLMHPATPACAAVTFDGTPPVQDGFVLHERDRAMPGSRWFRVWQSPGRVFRIDSVSFRLTGKAPPLCKFAFVLSGTAPDGSVTTLFEEALLKVPIVRGEGYLVSDGLTLLGGMLGNLSGYASVMLELFEPDRGFQWVDITDITIKALVPHDTGFAGSDSALESTAAVPDGDMPSAVASVVDA